MKERKPNRLQITTLYNLLRLSSSISHLKQIHSRLLLLGLHQHQHQHHFIFAHLILSLSQRFSSFDYALSIYSHFPNPNTFLFNAMLQSLSLSTQHQKKTISVYLLQMRNAQCPSSRPNCFTFPSLLKSCAVAFSLIEPIKEIHTHVVKFGSCSDVYVGTALLDSYVKVGDLVSSRQVFGEMPVRNVASWNSMVSGLAKWGDVDSARKLFEEIPEKNVVSWTSMISGYSQNGYFYETLAMFEEMGNAGVRPNDVTLVSVLSACGNLGALGLGKRIHGFLDENGYGLNLFVGSALIDMYCKCGMVGDALMLFERMSEKNVVVCSAMIMGLAMHGRGLEALAIFEDMRRRGMQPNEITFIGVLCACCHVGLVGKGHYYFCCMSEEYSIVPKLPHYACMVDLLGRAGLLGEAYQFIAKMSIKPDVVVWGALLGACRTHGDFELGERVAQQMLELDPKHCGAFVFLCNAYSRAANWDGLTKITKMMEISGMKRTPGRSWIEVNNVVHQFFAGDKSHPLNDRIYAKLDELAKLLAAEGYSPNTKAVVYDVEEEEKQQSLFVHSEKIAIAFGLVSTPAGTDIRIVKNLRVCDDCHSAIKLVSKIVARVIILRDGNRFHHFVGGMCSCKDYW
ncbi:hypothetical protein MRB53_008390 [Persea americana]|uniref:Uncharacterized protein n=1 Tax=Persea americana TaxID=3435 RepID=A0ACC2MLN8_PERAE|nr:hypothetical protein MRB53_008390 [Persea americana]